MIITMMAMSHEVIGGQLKVSDSMKAVSKRDWTETKRDQDTNLTLPFDP